jgi:hypothetical protein
MQAHGAGGNRGYQKNPAAYLAHNSTPGRLGAILRTAPPEPNPPWRKHTVV